MNDFEQLFSNCINAFNIIESELLIAEWLAARVNEAVHINLRANDCNDSNFTNCLLEIDKQLTFQVRSLKSEIIDTALKNQ